MFKKIMILIATVSLMFVPMSTHKAEALYYPLTCSNSSGYGNRICFDVSAGMSYVYDTGTHIYASKAVRMPMDNTFPYPGGSSVASDASCKVIGEYNGQPVTSHPAFNGTETVDYWYEYWTPGAWWSINLPSAQYTSIVAWMANSETGYECIIVG